MAQFTYKILDKTGKPKKGTLEAENIDKAKAMLKAEGGTVLKLEEASVLNKEINISFGKKKTKVRDLGVFCKQFKSILQAGIGIVDALEMLSQQTNSKVLKESLKNVKDALAGSKQQRLSKTTRKPSTPTIIIFSYVLAREKVG